jgi:hypothetical protein
MDVVDAAGVEARDAAHDDADAERDQDADQADRERHLRADDDPRQQVAAEAVGAEQEGAALGHAEQVDVGADHAQEPVRVAAHEQADGLRRVGQLGVEALPGDGVAVLDERVDEGPHQLPLVPDADGLRRAVDVAAVLHGDAVGREERRDERHQVQHDQDDRADDAHLVGREAPPGLVGRLRAGVGARVIEQAAGVHGGLVHAGRLSHNGSAGRPRRAPGRRGGCRSSAAGWRTAAASSRRTGPWRAGCRRAAVRSWGGSGRSRR